MTLKVRTAAGLKEITRVRVRASTGVHRITKIQVRTSGGLETVFFEGGGDGTITAPVDPTFVSGRRSSNSPVVVVSNSTTVAGQGGTAPYTYAWSSGTDIEPIYPASATTGFRSTSPMTPNTSVEETFTCTVTDANGRVETTPAVTVRLILNSFE